jgi:E3 ubiquitin-protein ligase RNF14
MRTFLNAETNFVYCLAEGCESGQIHDTGVEGPIFRCAACGFRMCTAHDPVIPFHENEACTHYNERIELERVEREARDEGVRVRREQDEASAAEAGRLSVECPGCGVQIQKIDGCDHMTRKLNSARPTLTNQ